MTTLRYDYENRVRNLHVSGGSRSLRPALCYQTTRRRASQAGCSQSEQARTKAQTKAPNYETFRLGPRFRVLVDLRRSHLACDFIPGETFSYDLAHSNIETSRINPYPRGC
jgi:hypothetical protein